MRIDMRHGIAIWIGLSLFALGQARAAENVPLLAQTPTLSKTAVVFVYGGTLWTVAREGGAARQLTTGGHERSPVFSPDGRWLAFTAQYDGNVDAYVMPSGGGEPKRLTWHPGNDVTVGWTPDGKSVLFSSDRDSYADFHRLYTVPVAGGPATVLPMWRGETASYSPDGTRVAYVPNFIWQTAWKRYRGGQTTPIDLIRLSDLALEKVPRENSNDTHPAWLGDTVYFLSDRNGPVTLFAYDTRAKTVRQVIENRGLDIKSLAAGPDALVYEQFGEIHLFDPAGGSAKKLDITIVGDLPAVRPHFVKVADKILAGGISPGGSRAVFEARGEILTVPAEKGDIRNLTRSTAVAERDPAWSPDGKSIAFFSDESGEYALHVVDASGSGTTRKIDLATPPSFFYGPIWSPDSRRIAYTDKRLNLWYVEVEKGKPTKVATDRYEDPTAGFSPKWSPDGKWLAYAKLLESHLRAVFVYSLDAKKETQITESMGDARYPVFDKEGKLLYFTVSTDLGLTSGWLDLSSYQHPVLRSVYAAVLKKGDPSPAAPQSDEEKEEEAQGAASGEKGKEEGKAAPAKDGKKDEKGDDAQEEPVKVTIDLDGIGQRIVALPIEAANYVGLDAGAAGTLFLAETVDVPRLEDPPALSISKFDLATRKTEPFLSKVRSFALSARGEKALYRQEEAWFLVATAEAPKPGDGALNLAAMEVYVDPRAEWNQMYREVWRIERDFFYDPNHHGLDLAAAQKKYAPYLEGLGGRADLNYLFDEMLGELTVGHLFVVGGDLGSPSEVKGGLLGADYEIDDGRYRFAKIYDGENWNPDLQAPLTQPGVEVKKGEYLLAVEGRDVRPPADVYSFFENTAGKQIKIKVGPHPDGQGAREVTVVPLPTEQKLRN
ncbi:MAG TPA: PDZ domain-containing protein, partial [Thermoanaerobaculia bacterium]|nr:PDZ domain-containing protein [Thermoanaerobaculia bacterium]